MGFFYSVLIISWLYWPSKRFFVFIGGCFSLNTFASNGNGKPQQHRTFFSVGFFVNSYVYNKKREKDMLGIV